MGRSGCSAVRWRSMSWSAQLSCANRGVNPSAKTDWNVSEVIAEYPSILRGYVTVEVPPLQGRGMNALVVGQLHSPFVYGRGSRFGGWAR